MTKTTLQRIQALADADPSTLYQPVASILRKLAGADDAVDKAHTVSGIVKKLDASSQERVLQAVESLRAP